MNQIDQILMYQWSIFRKICTFSKASTKDKEKFLFVYQSAWMKRLLLLYGQELCLLDATYRVCR